MVDGERARRAMRYRWADDGVQHELALVRVPATGAAPYTFGEPPQDVPISVQEFFLATVPVTQALWRHITRADSPAQHRGAELPVDNVSWDALTGPGGFLQRVNESRAAALLSDQAGGPLRFRLPTETEWEYAARGGPRWGDAYRYSGSNDVDSVAWYERRHGDWTQPAARKAPNQLGIHDMSGNVWEWCQDTFAPDVMDVPTDGTAHEGGGGERVLRGGCFHNLAEHCTVSKWYHIAHDYNDGCIGFRLAMSEVPQVHGSDSL